MILKLKDKSVVSSNDEGLWEDDALRRQSSAETLLRIVGCRNEAISFCLNSGWGTGKTFFLTRFCEQYRRCKNGDVPGVAIYFNAWKDDNLEDPLVAVIGQLWSALKLGPYSECMKAVATSAPNVFRRIVIRSGLGLIKSVPVLGKVAEEIEEVSSSADLTTPSERVFEEYEELNAAKNDLRDRLRELGDRVYASTGRPLLFVIDELDRCRPIFAIQLLERVKHICGVSNIVFLFGVDCEQLKGSVRTVYGDVDAENYLNRFFDIELCLPPANNEQFLWRLLEERSFDGQQRLSNVFMNMFKTLAPLSEIHGFSLRELEKAERTMTMLVATGLLREDSITILLPILLVLRMRNVDVYEKVANGGCQYAELLDALLPNVVNGKMVEKCHNVIRYLTQWFVQDRYDAGCVALRGVLEKTCRSKVISDDDKVVLPELFQNVPFESVNDVVSEALAPKGWIDASEKLPIIVNALGCLRFVR